MSRFWLIAACTVLPCAGLGAQGASQAGRSAGVESQAGSDDSRDERSQQKKNRRGLGGFSFGSGMELSFKGNAESVTQQDFCVGACGPLRSIARNAASADVPGLYGAGNPSSESPRSTKASGVLALLASLGSMSDGALEAFAGPDDNTANDHGQSIAAAAHARNAARKAAKQVELPESGPDFSAPVFACMIGCAAASSATTFSSDPSEGTELFSTGQSLITPQLQLTAGDVGTIVNPEPGTVALTLVGLLAVAGVARRKRSITG